MVVGYGDSLYVFDRLNGTLSVFDPDYDFVRSTRLQIVPTMFVEGVGHGKFVFSSWVRTAERIGYPLHLVNSEGRVEMSFGSETGRYRPDQADLVRLASAGPGRVWTGVAHRYALELWDAFQGRKVREVRRDVEWFPSRSPGQSATGPPSPTLWLFSNDRRDQLWVQVSVADPRWREAIDEDKPHQPYITDSARYDDMIVEILDAENGKPLATMKLDEGFMLVDSSEGLVGRSDFDHELVQRFKIWRVELVPRREEP